MPLSQMRTGTCAPQICMHSKSAHVASKPAKQNNYAALQRQWNMKDAHKVIVTIPSC
jgi:hypothetical protein